MSLLARDFLAPFRRRTAPEARAPLAEVEPAAGLTRVSGRGPRNRLATRLRRRRRVSVVGAAESLEQRLALAVVTPFDVRFSANDTGDITFAANTIMTAPGDSPRAQLARAGIPDPILGDQILNNDFWDMAYVDIDGDPTTFNSSAADLVLPVDAEVLFAGLYWGGRARGQTQFDNFGNVKFRGPDDGAYRNLSTTIISSTTQGAPSGARNYQSFIDVTDIVEAQGGGTYTTANVQAFAGAENYSAGWSLVVAFREPGAAARNLTVFDGFAFVTTSDPDVTINISGFQAPPAGPVTGTLGFIAYEGDLGITGDRAFFNGGLGEQQLSNATNPANNFFNSSISDLGLTVTTKNPNYVNQLGFGADLLAADGLIANSATAGTVRLTTTQDFYYPGVITSAIDLYAPKVSVLKGVTDLDGGDVIAGDTLRYTITVSNAASALDAAVGVLLNDALPANTTFVPGSLVITAGANSGGKTDAADADQGEYLAIEEAVRFQLGTGAGGALPVPVGGRLAPGQSTTISFDVTIDPDVLAGTIISNTSRASFTAETSRFELFATSNRVDVECRPSADLAITKTDGELTAIPGEALTYTIVVTNNGPDPVTGATVSDTFPAALLGAAWTVSYTGGGSGPAGGVGNIATAVSLPALATATFVVTATIDPLATGTLSNTATVLPPAGVTDPNLANNTATDTTILVPTADLAVVKTRTSGAPVAGAAVSYLITVTNNGPSTILGFTLTDTTAPVLIGATFGSPSMGSYNSGTGAWTGLMLATGQSVTITLSGTVPGAARGDLDNTAVVAPPPDVTDPNLDNNTSIVSDVLALVADLNVVKIRTSSQPVAGEAVTYQITVTNQGPTTIDSFGGVDVTTPALENPTYAVDVGTYDPGTGIWTGPALATGGVVVFTLTGTVPAGATGLLVNTATVSPPPGVTDPDPSDDSSTVTDEIDLVSDLAVVKTRTSGAPVAGAAVSYLITVTNNGPSTILGFTLTDTTAPALIGATFGSPSMGSYNSGTGAWTGLMLATGQSVTITLSGTVPGEARGDLDNTAVVAPPPDVTDPNLDNNTSIVSDVLALVADLNVVKIRTTGQPVAGEAVTYQITVTNQGPTTIDSFGGVDVTTPALENPTYAVDVGSYDPGTGIWTGPALATGGVVVFTLTGTVPAGATGLLVNTATVSPPPGVTDPDPSDDSSTVTDEIDLVSDLAVVKTRTSGAPVAGAAVSYLITVTNNGPSTILGFTLTDTTAPVLIGATFGSPSMGSYNSGTGAWTGLMLATGQSVTITLSGTVPGAARGDLDNTAVVAPPPDVTDPNLDNNTSIVSDVLALVADLNVVKIRTSGQPVAGEAVTYQITVTNQGPTTIDSFGGVDVTTPALENPTYAVDVGSYDPGTGIWTGPALATGGVVVFTLTGTVPAGATGLLVNTATVSPPPGVTDPDPSDDSSTVTDEIDLVSDLAVVKTRTSGSPVAGAAVEYLITVTNNGPSTILGFTLTDTTAPALIGATFGSPSMGSYNSGTGAWTGLMLATGQSVTITLSGTVPGEARGDLDNTAVVAPPPDVTDPNLDNNTSIVSDVLALVADLNVLKIRTSGQPVAGEAVTYQITVTNQGPTTIDSFGGVDVTTPALENPTYAVDVGTYDPGTGIWTGPALATGGVVVFTLTGTVPAAATGLLVNTATVSPPPGVTDPDPSDDSSTVTDEIDLVSDLAVVKTRTSGAPVAGAAVSYLITVTNNGPSTILGFTLTDTTAPALIGATFGSPSMGSYNSGTGAWTGLMLATGQSVTITLSGTVPGAARGDLDNTAVVAPPPDVTDPNLDNNTSIVSDVLALVADLNVVKIRTTGQPVAGEAVTYQITVTNQGPTTIDSFGGVDVTTPALENPTYAVDVGTYDPGTGIWTGPALATGGVVVFTLTGTVPAGATGLLVNTATVSPPPGVTDPDPSDDSSTVTDEIDLVSDLAVVKTRTSGAPVAGLPVTYSIVVSNLGPSSLTSFTGTDMSTPMLEGIGFTVSTGTYDPISGLWTADPGDEFTTGETVIFTLTGTVPAGATGLLVNTATALPPVGVTDPDLSNNTSTVTDELGGVVDLTATKTGDVTYKGGGFLNYTMVITNLGPSFASGVRVVDLLPTGIISWSWSVSYTGVGSGTADGSPDSVIDSTAGIDKLMNLAVLGTATFTISALTDALFQSDITNTVVATLGQESATATWTSAYDGPINPTEDVGALVVSNDDLCFGLPFVRVLDPDTGAILSQFLAYEPSFRGSVRVATGDVTGDGVAEIVVAPGRNRIGQIRVFTPDGVELPQYRTLPFGPAYRGGVDVAVGDIDGDGDNDIIASRSSGLSRVSVFGVDPLAVDPVTNVPIRSFIGIPGAYRNGAVITAGDYGTFASGMMVSAVPDGIAEIAVGSNAGIRAQVRVFDASVAPRLVSSFVAIRPGFRGGVTLSSARWDGDTADDIIVGAGVGGRSIVEVYGGAAFTQLARLAAFSTFGRPNAAVNAAALDITGDGVVDNLFGVQGRGGSGGTRGVKRFDRLTTATATLPSSTVLVPPLRIAPITLRILGG